MPIDRAAIVHVADLARITSTEDEIERFPAESIVFDAVERSRQSTSENPQAASSLPPVAGNAMT